MKTESKTYNSLDVLKFILSIFVLIIHSGIDKTIISPLLRIAVPMFFIISSYLFFSKLEKISDEKERRTALFHLVKRNLYLYLFWVVLQLPVFIYGKHYHTDFFPNGIFNTIRDVLLGKGFTGSWYIISLVLGTVIIYYLLKKLSVGTVLCITLPFYVVCCLTTNYLGLFDSQSLMVRFANGYETIVQTFFNTSLPGGLFWIGLGCFFAKKRLSVSSCALYIMLAISAITIATERFFIVKYGLQYLDDCYFSLILLCSCIFLLVLRNNIAFKSKFRYREISTLVYVIHGTCGRIVGFVLKALPLEFLKNEIIKVCITVCVAIVLSYIFLFIRDNLKFKILKYGC